MTEWLELIRGLVRPFVTTTLTILVIYMAIIGKMEPKEVLLLYGPILGFWFGSKQVKIDG